MLNMMRFHAVHHQYYRQTGISSVSTIISKLLIEESEVVVVIV
ncbi:3152_t:CDS:1, partial [Entrophospora sp. SA101]